MSEQRLHSLLSTVFLFAIIMAQQPVFAQWTPQGLPRISRMCLWNGDKTTWSKLNLSRYQVSQMEELRRQYPAVIDAQWVVDEDDAPEISHAAIGQPAASDAIGASGDKQFKTQPPTAGDRLQAELRLVLSADQIRRWHRLCAGPEKL